MAALSHHVSLSAQARADIARWLNFLPSWNGRAFFPSPPVTGLAMRFSTDASGVGFGAVYGSRWLFAAWRPPSFRTTLIFSSCLPSPSQYIAWGGGGGGRLADRQVLLHTDNLPIAQVWLSGSCKDVLRILPEGGCPHPFPMREYTLELFVVLRDVRFPAATLKVYLAGLQYFSCRLRIRNEIVDMRSLIYVLRGLRRSEGARFTRPPRRPITVTTLLLLCAQLRRRFPARDAIMLRAAVLSAFFGLLRSFEYCAPSPTEFDSVSLDSGGSMMWLRIKASKTDPFRGGSTVRLCRSESRLCTYAALFRYLGLHPHPPQPALRLPDGGVPNAGAPRRRSARRLPQLVRSQHPLLPHWGRVSGGCDGHVGEYDPRVGPLEVQLLPALRSAPGQICFSRQVTAAKFAK